MKAAMPDIQTTCGTQCAIGHVLPKGISDCYVGVALAQAISEMKAAEAVLAKSNGKRKLRSFGYKATEALYAIDGTSIPNNVFPLFWWGKLADQREYRTVLVRA